MNDRSVTFRMWSAVLLSFVQLACGGSSGGAAIPGPIGGSVPLRAMFVADLPNPGPDSVALAQNAASGAVVTVDIRLTDVAVVYGASFDLLYDPTMASFVNWSSGTILEQGAHVPRYQLDATQPGHLVIVATRVGPVAGVEVTGTQTLMSLTFRVTRVGTDPLSFRAESLFDDQLRPQPVAGIRWHGGSLVGFR